MQVSYQQYSNNKSIEVFGFNPICKDAVSRMIRVIETNITRYRNVQIKIFLNESKIKVYYDGEWDLFIVNGKCVVAVDEARYLPINVARIFAGIDFKDIH